ncbi:ATPase [Eubacterium sp. AF22-8LB]|jgi:rod shape-determining protein MreB|uniref:rod shape-determining protein n=1 Tax=Bacillota TaxID=1239 RepID=UPI000E533B3C|nr:MULTISPECIES: rod shape-determining protein [Bacillota]MBU9896922.1 rod shape-determining protein [Holdemanella biformis]MBV3418003.1 rod shape-determining protein [Holdemanella biformis]MEE0496106.1 rod shape-determining protein [Cyanobacteriota bacterium]RGS28094.1 ATPase [Eubacterium sp. AF22-8LB]
MIRMGIDLGTNYIRLCTQEDGLLYNEPCMVALDNQNHVLGIGEDAKDLIGTMDSNVRIISPLRENPINFDVLDILLDQLLYEHKAFRMFQKTILLVSYPTSFSKESCDILKEHLEELGAYRVYFEQEIWIAAIGAKLDLFLPVASCVLNIGSSNCDIALFMNGKMEKKSRCNISGVTINSTLKNWLFHSYNINASSKQVEKIKRKIGQVMVQQNPKSIEVVGMDRNTHVLKSITINENQVVGILAPLVQQWSNWILQFLSSLPLTAQQDVKTRGIICCGGSMLLKGLPAYLQNTVGCPIFVTDDPINTVSAGLMILLSRLED